MELFVIEVGSMSSLITATDSRIDRNAGLPIAWIDREDREWQWSHHWFP